MAALTDDPYEVALIDGHAILLDGLAALLGQEGLSVVAMETRWDDAVSAVCERQPDLCIAEIMPPTGAGAEGIAMLLDGSPGTSVVVLTADPSADQLNSALAAGASGYIHKTRTAGVLLDALRRIRSGEIVIEGSFTRRRVENDPLPIDLARYASFLTPRERECLSLLADGQATTAMSIKLGVSRTTVRTHVQSVLTKLGVHSRLEAAALATRYGLVERHVGAAMPRILGHGGFSTNGHV